MNDNRSLLLIFFAACVATFVTWLFAPAGEFPWLPMTVTFCVALVASIMNRFGWWLLVLGAVACVVYVLGRYDMVPPISWAHWLLAIGIALVLGSAAGLIAGPARDDD
jgi:hypothetical protein